MHQTSMVKHLSLILLKTFLISSVIAFAGTAILVQRPADDHFQCDMSGIAYGVAIGMVVLLTASATTIYLNLKYQVRNNTFYSILSFFLLPAVLATLLIASLGEWKDTWPLYAIITLPFMAAMLFHFLQFRRNKIGI
jgi:hypothetical protein